MAHTRMPTLKGVRRTWFCGSYCGSGFHEDGLCSGLEVAAALGSPPPWWATSGRDRRPESVRRPERDDDDGISAFYFGRVSHKRYFPRHHRFSYGVWYMLVDLDELTELEGPFSVSPSTGRAVSFHARDHGASDGSPLRPWIESLLAAYGVDLEGGPIRLLTFPRVTGYVFNPLSVWFCHRRDESLQAILYEVSNTFGEHHADVVPMQDRARERGRDRAPRLPQGTLRLAVHRDGGRL